MASSVSAILLKAAMKHPRLIGPLPNGTRPIDLKIFQQVIRETFADKAVMQNVVNAAMKKVEFKVR